MVRRAVVVVFVLPRMEGCGAVGVETGQQLPGARLVGSEDVLRAMGDARREWESFVCVTRQSLNECSGCT